MAWPGEIREVLQKQKHMPDWQRCIQNTSQKKVTTETRAFPESTPLQVHRFQEQEKTWAQFILKLVFGTDAEAHIYNFSYLGG
jgi:hypothetical protein